MDAPHGLPTPASAQADGNIPFGPPAPPNLARRISPQKLDSFASFGPDRFEGIRPSLNTRLFLGQTLEGLNDWMARFEAIEPDNRVGQMLYLREPVEEWVIDSVRRPHLESRGIVALAIFVQTGLWQDYADSEGRHFRTPHEFVHYCLELWGIGASDSRVSRRLTTGKLWLKLRGLGLPVPDSLSRLEHFGQRGNAVEIYRELVCKIGRLPSELHILAALGKLKPPGETESTLEKMKLLAAEIHALGEQFADQVPAALREKITALQILAHPPQAEKAPKPHRPKKILPPYDASLGCPFTVTTEANRLRIQVQSLPPEWEVELSKKARSARWECVSLTNGATVIAVPFDGSNPSEVRAKVLATKKRLAGFCHRLKAPAPAPEQYPSFK